jgi:hypothetical protein
MEPAVPGRFWPSAFDVWARRSPIMANVEASNPVQRKVWLVTIQDAC